MKGDGGIGSGNAELRYKFQLNDEGLTIGGRVSADATLSKLGGDLSGTVGSGSGMSVGADASAGAGVGAGGNLKIDRTGIHVNLSDGLNAGVFSFRGSYDLAYEDMKKPGFIIGSAILGPAGGIAGLKAQEIGPGYIMEALKFVV